MIYRLFAFLVLAAGFASVLSAESLQKFTVKNAVEREAVCNDGSPAVYYFRAGSGQASKKWVIFLGGGGFCYSVEDCNRRKVKSPHLMTSINKPSTLEGNGILSDSESENPDFFNATHVVISYCSSDLWSGNREKSAATGGHEFRGSRIVRPIIKDLKNRPSGPTLASATTILFVGTSAGGVGVMVHLDWLANQLPKAKVKGLNDAGWAPDLSFFVPVSNALEQNYGLELWNGKPDGTCAEANEGSEYRCYTSKVYPHVTTPLMVQMSQFDTVFLSSGGVRPPFDSMETFLAGLFASAVRDSLTPVHAAFSPRTHTHGLLHNEKFFRLKINGLSLREVLGNWFFERTGPIKVIKE